MIFTTQRKDAVSWVDVALICLGGMAAVSIRKMIGEAPSLHEPTRVYLVASSIMSLLLWFGSNLRARSVRLASRQDVVTIAAIALIGPIVGLTITFLVDRSEGVARSIPIIQMQIVFVGMLMSRVVGRFGHNVRQDKDFYDTEAQGTMAPAIIKNVIAIGDARSVAAYIRALETVVGTHFYVAGAIVCEAGLVGSRIRGVQVLGTVDTLSQCVATLEHEGTQISQLVVTTQAISQQVADATLARTIPVTDLFELFDDTASPTATPMGDLGPRFALKPNVRAYMPIKRSIDIICAGLGLLVSWPIMALTAVFVRIMLGAPVLFWQWRPGRNGQSFKLYKFRSMRHPIDRAGNILRDDQRLGRFGTLLRRTRFDELPQLLNIFRGDMALIGPRPLIREHQERNGPRLAVRPGLTGWAQIHGGHLATDEQKLAMDLWYVDRASIWLDIRIVFGTILVILFGDNPQRALEAAQAAQNEISERQSPPVLREEPKI